MAGGFQFQVTYDAFDISTSGIGFIYQNVIYLSGLSIVTEGLIYGKADIWLDADDCQTVTWTEVGDP